MEAYMSIEDLWRPFQEIMEAPWEWARSWKQKTGRKMIGHLLPDVPEEIIHAAGALPMAVEGAGVQIGQAQAHIPGYTCSHAMGAIEMGMTGKLDVLDGMVIPYVCDTTRNLFHIWNRCFPHMSNEFLRLPKRIDYPGARDYLCVEFTRLLSSIAEITGKKAGPDEVARSSLLYDKSRKLLRDAYRMQQERPALWTQEKVQLLFASALRAPREEHLTWMEALPWDQEEVDCQVRIPIYVKGKVWDPPGILSLFDKLGLLVVSDEIVTGFRLAEKDVGLNGNPIESLAQRYISLTPYPGYHMEPDRLIQGFLDRVGKSGAAGVVFINPKFCEAAGFEMPDFQKALGETSIPSLILETSSRSASMEQIRLRLEAFRELLSGDLP